MLVKEHHKIYNLTLGYIVLYTNGGISEYCMSNNSKNYNYSDLNKNGEVFLSHKQQMILLFHSHVSAHRGHHQVIREKYTNSDGIMYNFN
jgi:hypothetical protein